MNTREVANAADAASVQHCLPPRENLQMPVCQGERLRHAPDACTTLANRCSRIAARESFRIACAR